MNQPPKKKIRSRHKVNVRKESKRQRRIAKKQEKKSPVPKEKHEKKEKQKSVKEAALNTKIERETKIYWLRGAIGAISALILRSIGFVGWTLLIWLGGLLILVPFVINFIKGYKMDKEEWTWKNILKPGALLFFLLFMLVGVIVHTLFELLNIGIKITFQGIIF